MAEGAALTQGAGGVAMMLGLQAVHIATEVRQPTGAEAHAIGPGGRVAGCR